ncbi:hypothetical protein COI47_29765, partial [Bacillus pseudomycoides]
SLIRLNELSIWTAYCIFCLAWVFSKTLAVPHANQANILKCPQNENFIILQLFMRIQLIFFVLGYLLFLT